MVRRRRRGSVGGFTLLEAVMALAILGAVCIVCVGMRAQALAAQRRIAARHAREADARAVFEALVNGLLPRETVDGERGVRRWEGEHVGERWVLEARRVTMANPLYVADEESSAGLSPQIYMWRYTLESHGGVTEFYWHR